MSTSPSTKLRPVELFATLGLALSSLVALTAVSIGIARADGHIARAGAQTVPIIAVHR